MFRFGTHSYFHEKNKTTPYFSVNCYNQVKLIAFFTTCSLIVTSRNSLSFFPFNRKRHGRNDESQEEGVDDNDQPKKKKSRRTRDAESEEKKDDGEPKSTEE